MEYGIAIAITLFFVVLYTLRRDDKREHYFKTLNDTDFKYECILFCNKNSTQRLSTGILTLSDSLRQIKKTAKKLSKGNKIESDIKSHFFDLYNHLSDNGMLSKSMQKRLVAMQNLPQVDGIARIIQLVRFMLSHSDYMLFQDRVDILFDAQNSAKSLTYAELLSFSLAIEYVSIKQFSVLCREIDNLLQMQKYAKKCTKQSYADSDSPLMKSLKQNKLFLSIFMHQSKSCWSELDVVYRNTIDICVFLIDNILMSLKNVEMIDILKHYHPLEILNKYDSFYYANYISKTNFLQCFELLSDQENLDTSAYVQKLDIFAKKQQEASAMFSRMSLFGQRIVIKRVKPSLKTLSDALLSNAYMHIYFGESRSNFKKLYMKVGANENSNMLSEPNYTSFFEDYEIKLGLENNQNSLKIDQNLPDFVDNLSFDVNVDNNKHHINFVKGDSAYVMVDSTEIKGISHIKLGKQNSNITVQIARTD